MSEENEKIEEVDEDIYLEDIVFDDKNLIEWEEDLTIILPSLPCTSFQITSALINLNNKYQIAYNNYNKLLVLASKAEKKFDNEKNKLISIKLKDYASKGVAKSPTLDKLETIVLNDNTTLQDLYELSEMYSIIRDFFKNNKIKLENIMEIVRSISYSVNASDKNLVNGRENHGL